MLVLSRRQNESVCFPNLGIKVSVLRSGGKVTRLGIDAPDHVRIVRDELVDPGQPGEWSFPETAPQVAGMNQEQRHAFRNRLNAAGLGLQLLQQRIESGDTDDLESLIYRIFTNLDDLNSQLEQQKQAGTTDSGLNKNPRRALVVEDNANEGQLLAEFFRASGYQTEIVRNGLEAIAYLQQHEQPDVVLMDMNMPEMDGAETIRSIRSQPELNQLKLYGVSGLESNEAGVPVGVGGVDRWFTKPVDARRLVSEINRELDVQGKDRCGCNV
jgi:carbon storage regulator CsrA